MQYVSLAGLEAALGPVAFARWSEENGEAALADCEARLLAVILPAQVRTDEQAEAFRAAVYAQVRSEWQGLCPPPGLRSFSLGDFSAETNGGGRACETARAHLLAAGLLYRGVGAC